MVIGKKISKLEKNLSSYASKNAELDAKILSLGSSKSLAEFIAEHCMVSVTARNSVKIPRGEANLNPPAYASVADNFSQTN
jgi:hypothetical protein